MSTSTEKQSFDPARRRLCPDGACIGLLDDAGRCKECGLVAGTRPADAAPAAPAPDQGQPEPEAQAQLDDDDHGEASFAADGGADQAVGDGARFDPARRLCPDGACLGVLGSDGRCPVCGRTAED
jgi:hypothetical protein